MSSISIKNFGPIKEGTVDIQKVTLLCGPQGAGKSTVAKLLSTFLWIEKALVRGAQGKKWFEQSGRFKKQFLTYHRLENYDTGEDAEINYEGEAYSIVYRKGTLAIKEKQGQYGIPKIMYVPAERNFISYIRRPNLLKLASPALQEFLTEFDNSKQVLKEALHLPISDVNIEYDRLNDNINLRSDTYRIRLSDAASGFQSFIPLYLVSHYLAHSVASKNNNDRPMSQDERKRFQKDLADIWENTAMTEEQKRLAISTLSAKSQNSAFVNIVEEPEQNLFPQSQIVLINELVKFANLGTQNKLLMTTHSPYVLIALTLAAQARQLKTKIDIAGKSAPLFDRLNAIVPLESTIASQELAIYQLDEHQGSIEKLPMRYGVPADTNYLNTWLNEGNIRFDKLLEIEEDL
jgi:predicted ATPase